MGMFDDVVVNAKAAANAFSKKAGNIYDISKLKFNANSIKGEINKKCQELGEMVYESKLKGGSSQQLIDAKIDEIKALKDDLTAINELLATAKNLMICPACSAVIAKDSVFCNKCGIRIEGQAESDKEDKAHNNPENSQADSDNATVEKSPQE